MDKHTALKGEDNFGIRQKEERLSERIKREYAKEIVREGHLDSLPEAERWQEAHRMAALHYSRLINAIARCNAAIKEAYPDYLIELLNAIPRDDAERIDSTHGLTEYIRKEKAAGTDNAAAAAQAAIAQQPPALGRKGKVNKAVPRRLQAGLFTGDDAPPGAKKR